MDPSTVATLFALVLVVLVGSTVAALAVPTWRAVVARHALWITAFVGVGATLGSLYFSERADFIPCEMCWFQRIAMYPLGVMLTIAAVRRDRRIFTYALPIAAIGLAFSAYHVWIQWFPESSNLCSLTDPCSAKWVESFGFYTIPQMAGTCFAVILVTGTLALLHDRRRTLDRPAPDTATGLASDTATGLASDRDPVRHDVT